MSRSGTGTGSCDLPRIDHGGGDGRPYSWGLKSDRDGFRDYDIMFIVRVNPLIHGPYAAWTCPGLPIPGDVWDEIDLIDEWAFFTQEGKVEAWGNPGPGNEFFAVHLVASTRPTKDCASESGQDPLTVPNRVNVRTITYQKEGTQDRFGDPIDNSAFELFRGPQNEWDAHRLQVVIDQNVANLEIELIDSLMHNLNDDNLWGFPARTVKLSAAEIDPQYRTNCEKYYKRRLTFDVAFDFDRDILDEGTKALRGQWDTNPSSPTYGAWVIASDEDGPYGLVDPTNPRNYIRYKDWNAENTRVILNGAGIPVDTSSATPGTADDVPGRIHVEYYPSGNLLQLGIPLDLENP